MFRRRHLPSLVLLLSMVAAVALVGACGGGGSSSQPAGSVDAGGSDGGSPVTDGAVDGPDGYDTPAASVLRVRIVGLPAGMAGHVDVIDAGFMARHVTSDVDIPLPPGTYQVVAAAVGTTTALDSTSWVPDVAAQQVSVSATQGARVVITYAPTQLQLADNVRIADAATTAALQALMPTDSVHSRLVFGSATPLIAALKPGDVLAIGQGAAAAPNGYFGLVDAVNGNVVDAERTGLAKLFTRGAIVLSHDPSLNGDVSASFWAGQSQPGISAGATVSCDVPYSVDVSWDISINVKTLTAHFDGSLNGTVGWNVAAQTTGQIGGEVPVLTAPLGVIWVGPLGFAPVITVALGADATASSGVTYGGQVSFAVSGGFDGNLIANEYTPFQSSKSSFTAAWPQVESDMTIEAYARPEIAMMLDGLVGPYLGLKAGLQLDGSWPANASAPNWTISGDLSLETGFDLDLGIGTYSQNWTLGTWTFPIWDSSNPPPLGSVVGTPPPLPATGGLAIDATGTNAYVGSGNSVVAISAIGGKPVWSYSTYDAVIGVEVAPNGSIVARDKSGYVYDIDPSGKHKWLSYPPPAGSGASWVVIDPVGSNPIVAWNRDPSDTMLTEIYESSGLVKWSGGVSDIALGMAIDPAGVLWIVGESGVYAYDKSSGMFLNSLTSSTNNGPAYAGPPAIDGAANILYVPHISWDPVSGNGWANIEAIDIHQVAQGAQPHVLWDSGRLLGGELLLPLVGPDGTVYVAGSDLTIGGTWSPRNGFVEAIAGGANGGTTRWEVVGQGPGGFDPNDFVYLTSTPAIGGDGNLYVQTDRDLRAFSTATGKLLWQAADGQNETTVSSPVFNSSQMVLTGVRGGLYSVFAKTSLASPGWPRLGGNSGGTGVAP